jgi:hypothetical protein
MGKMIKQTAAQTFLILEKMKRQFAINPSPLLETTIANLARTAKSLMDSEMAAKEKNFLEKHTGSDWWELAKKQYPITQREDGAYVVTSEARDWEDTKDWTFNYKYEAFAKVEKLVNWLHDGRVRKGYGSIEADLEKFHAKYAS